MGNGAVVDIPVKKIAVVDGLGVAVGGEMEAIKRYMVEPVEGEI